MPTQSEYQTLQGAIYTLLRQDTTIISLTGADPRSGQSAYARVFDEPPEGTLFPYILIGDFDEVPWNKFSKKGRDARCTIHIWSDKAGMLEVENIQTAIATAMDNNLSGISVNGYSTEMVNLLRDETRREGLLRHGVSEYRILLLAT